MFLEKKIKSPIDNSAEEIGNAVGASSNNLPEEKSKVILKLYMYKWFLFFIQTLTFSCSSSII